MPEDRDPAREEQSHTGRRDPGEAEPPQRVPFSSSITVERTFRVDGKHVVVQAVIPAAAAKEIGMEATMQAARRLLLRLESKEARVQEIRRG